jgi:hypothetical protein
MRSPLHWVSNWQPSVGAAASPPGGTLEALPTSGLHEIVSLPVQKYRRPRHSAVHVDAVQPEVLLEIVISSGGHPTSPDEARSSVTQAKVVEISTRQGAKRRTAQPYHESTSPSAIDVDDLPGDVLGSFAEQECDERRDICRLPYTLQRDLPSISSQAFLVHVTSHVRPQ